MASVTTLAAVNCSSNCAMAAANVCRRPAVSLSFDRVCRLTRRPRSPNHVSAASSGNAKPPLYFLKPARQISETRTLRNDQFAYGISGRTPVSTSPPPCRVVALLPKGQGLGGRPRVPGQAGH